MRENKQGLPHELWKIKEEVACRRCGAKARIQDAKQTFLLRPCGGCAAGRAATQATGNRNFAWAKYATSWRDMQRAGAFLVAVVPIPRELVDYGRLDEAAKAQAWGYGAMVLPPEGGERAQVMLQRAGGEEGQENEVLRAANTYGVLRGGDTGQEGSLVGLGGMTPPWMRMPSWMHPHLEQAHEREAMGTWMRWEGGQEVPGVEEAGGWRAPREGAGRGSATGPLELRTGRGAHSLAFMGPLVYCTRCANFAHRRVGAGLKGLCAAPTNKRANAVAARLSRIQRGCHPLTGRHLVGHGRIEGR